MTHLVLSIPAIVIATILVGQVSLSALSSQGEFIPGATKLTNIARQGFSGHHYVIMALCSVVALGSLGPTGPRFWANSYQSRPPTRNSVAPACGMFAFSASCQTQR